MPCSHMVTGFVKLKINNTTQLEIVVSETGEVIFMLLTLPK